MEDARSRIKVSVGNSFIEIEGTEDYVEKKLKDVGSYNSLIKRLSEVTPPVTPSVETTVPKEVKQPEVRKKETTRKAPVGYSILPGLDLAEKNDIPSLANFYGEKKPANAMESNAVFVYYLKKLRNIEKIGESHIYTCYKAVKTRVPKAFYQSLIDTRKAKGWIITDSMDDIGIGIGGENFVEQDLPKPEKSKK